MPYPGLSQCVAFHSWISLTHTFSCRVLHWGGLFLSCWDKTPASARIQDAMYIGEIHIYLHSHSLLHNYLISVNNTKCDNSHNLGVFSDWCRNMCVCGTWCQTVGYCSQFTYALILTGHPGLTACLLKGYKPSDGIEHNPWKAALLPTSKIC